MSKFLPIQLKRFSNHEDGRRFYTAVKYQNYFMDKCSIFIMILDIFSCRRFCFEMLDNGENIVSISGLCFMQNRKMKTDKKLSG